MGGEGEGEDGGGWLGLLRHIHFARFENSPWRRFNLSLALFLTQN